MIKKIGKRGHKKIIAKDTEKNDNLDKSTKDRPSLTENIKNHDGKTVHQHIDSFYTDKFIDSILLAPK